MQNPINNKKLHHRLKEKHGNNIARLNGNNCLKGNRLIVVKSLSIPRNNSLNIKPFFRQRAGSPKARLIKTVTSQTRAKSKTDSITQAAAKPILNQSYYIKQLSRIRKLQKEDIFWKISSIERKIDRQIRYVKNRQNRKYIITAKANKIKSKNNSINLNDMSSLMTIKHIKNEEKQTINLCTTAKKFRIQTMNPKYSLLQYRALQGQQLKPICLSQLIKRSESNIETNDLEEFSGWKTSQDNYM